MMILPVLVFLRPTEHICTYASNTPCVRAGPTLKQHLMFAGRLGLVNLRDGRKETEIVNKKIWNGFPQNSQSCKKYLYFILFFLRIFVFLCEQIIRGNLAGLFYCSGCLLQ